MKNATFLVLLIVLFGTAGLSSNQALKQALTAVGALLLIWGMSGVRKK